VKTVEAAGIMGIIDNLKTAFYGQPEQPAAKADLNIGDGAGHELRHQGGLHKAHIPEFLYKPPFGYPRKLDLPLVRQLARSPYVFSVKKTIVDAVSTCDYEVGYREDWLEENDPTPELDKIKADIKSFFHNPNGNKESFNHIRRVLVSDILDVDAGVLVKVFNRKGEFQQVFARDGGSFLKNPDPYGYLGDRDDYISPDVIPMSWLTSPDQQNRDVSIQRYAGVVKDRAAYFQYASNTAALPIPFGKREVVYMMQNPQSRSVYGVSPIEILADVIVSLVYGALYNLDFYLNNNMPEGVLTVLGSDQKQLQAFGEQLRSTVKEPNKLTGFLRRVGFRIPITNKEVSFVPFQLDPKTMQVVEQQQWFVKLVWACFGATADGMGYTEDSNRSTGVVQSAQQKAKAVKPILELLKYHLDTEIISEWGPEAFEALEFRFDEYDLEAAIKQAELQEAQIRMGIKTAEMVAEEEGIDVDRLREEKEEAQKRQMEMMGGGGFGPEDDEDEDRDPEDYFKAHLKHKYKRRYRKGNRWVYEYDDPKGDRSKKQVDPKALSRKAEEYESQVKKEHADTIKKNVAAWKAGKDTFNLNRLEDGSFKPEREEIHREILSEYVKSAESARSKNPSVVFMAGLPGSGKTFSVKGIFEKVEGSDVLLRDKKSGENFIVVNADDIKAMLPEYDAGLGAALTHEESSHLSKALLTVFSGQSINVIVDGTMKTPESAKKVLSQFKEQNYESRLIFVDVDPSIAMDRAKARYESSDRYVPYSFISGIGDGIRDSVMQVRSEFSKFTHIDNNEKPKVISDE
jgi:hypothetical protein